jgi:3-oxoadipate enol-lactonase
MPFIEANGVNTYYEDYGEGEPLVVLHGATADHQVWAELLQPLTDQYRVLLYDLRGHGKTGGSDRESYSSDLYADDLAAFIDRLGLTKPTILGHSWGGMIGYTFAVKYPDSLSGLITVGAMTSQTLSKGEWLYGSVIMNIAAPVMANEWIENSLNWILKRIFGDETSGDMDKNEQIREEHGCDAPEVKSSERAKLGYALADYYGANRSIQGVSVPVLMLYGENELPFLETHAESVPHKASSANCC